MARIASKRYRLYDDRENDFTERSTNEFTLDINVSKEGVFAATLPAAVVQELKSAGIVLGKNRMFHEGFFKAKSMDELDAAVNAVLAEFNSRQIVEEKVVVPYKIQTECRYATTPDGKFHPNAVSEGAQWRQDGRESSSCFPPSSFGFSVYAVPRIKRVYQYASGKKVEVYSSLNDGKDVFAVAALEKDATLRWLSDLSIQTDTYHEKWMSQVDYTPQAGLFFKSVFEFIFTLNERIAGNLAPERIIEMAAKTNLLVMKNPKEKN